MRGSGWDGMVAMSAATYVASWLGRDAHGEAGEEGGEGRQAGGGGYALSLSLVVSRTDRSVDR